MRFYLTSQGCKLNQAEVEDMARAVQASGHVVVSCPEEADWAILNTCTVTHVAARKSRQALRQLRRASPALRIALTGCYAETDAAASSFDGVQLVVANRDKASAVQRILSSSSDLPLAAGINAAPVLRLAFGHTRAFVKVQDGCDNRCAYCIVGIARGPQRSVIPEQVLGTVIARLREGYQEIVLTGVNIGAYGRDSHLTGPLPPEAGWSLARLVCLILEHTGVPRLRLSSIEPWDVTPALVGIWPHPRLCRHLHLPLQSGCDATLARMGRRYNTVRFAAQVASIRAQSPDIALTTDVIVGFPGESTTEFGQTCQFIHTIGFSRLHVFKYSPRPGTSAAEMSGRVPPSEVHRRSQSLIALGRDLSMVFHQRRVGTLAQVLFEGSHGASPMRLWRGLTDDYVRVRVRSERNLSNTLATVRCLTADAEGLNAELAD